MKITHHHSPSLKFTDSHCHLDFPELSTDLTELLSRCQAQGIHRYIVPSISPTNWQSVLELADLSTDQIKILPATGIHPWYLDGLNDDALILLTDTVKANRDKIVAIGETGIDGKIADEFDNMAKQCKFFEYQLALANNEKLPLIIHHRKSHQELVTILKRSVPNSGGVVHGFSGSYQQAKHYLDLGLKLGIGGTISYERAKKTIKTISKLPLDSIVLETDAPAMPLSGYQGQPNSPLRLINVFELLVDIRTESEQDIAQQIEVNLDQLFGVIPTRSARVL